MLCIVMTPKKCFYFCLQRVQTLVQHSSAAVQKSILQSRGHRYGPTVSISQWFNFPVNKISHQHQSQYHHRSAFCPQLSRVRSFAPTKLRELITEKMMLQHYSTFHLWFGCCTYKMYLIREHILNIFQIFCVNNFRKIILNLDNSCKVFLNIQEGKQWN